MNLLFCNVHGASGNSGLDIIKTFKRLYNLCFDALFKQQFSGIKAQKLSRRRGLSNVFIEKAWIFLGGFWICWDNNVIDVNIVHTKIIIHSNEI